jgi:hypothetical protein
VDHNRTGQSAIIPAPDFGCYFKAFERQNNINWLPSVSNVPALPTLWAASVGVPNALRQVAAPPAVTTCAPPASERRDLGPRARNPGRDARFTGKTSLANNVRFCRVEEAIALAGGRETLPKIVCDGVSVGVSVFYHGKGSCSEGCIHAGSHIPLTAAEQKANTISCLVSPDIRVKSMQTT